MAFTEYNGAFIVEEWRKVNGSWRRIGHITRDFLIIVQPQQITRPDFELPAHQTLTASEVFEESIVFQDPDGDPIKVGYFGEVFDLENSPMTVSPGAVNFEHGPLTLTFEWTPLAEHNRDRPYYLHLKVTGMPPLDMEKNPSVTYKTLAITSNASSNVIIPDVMTDLHEGEHSQKIDLFPNPVYQKLRLNLPDTGPFKLIVYNSFGQQTVSLDFSSTSMKELDVSRLSAGLYFVLLRSDRNNYKSSFIKL